MTVEQQTNKEKENVKITFNKRFFFRIPMQGRHLVRDFFVVSGKKTAKHGNAMNPAERYPVHINF